MSETLVERLRKRKYYGASGQVVSSSGDPLCQEAASALTVAQAWIREEEAQTRAYEERIDRLVAEKAVAQARIERLERGLTEVGQDVGTALNEMRGGYVVAAELHLEQALADIGSVLFPDQEGDDAQHEHAAPQSGETLKTCPAERGEWCPDPACLAKCKHVPGGE